MAQQTSGGPVIFSGFGRGTHPINQLSTQLWDAHNIRLTAREGESYNSLTNEKSTLKLLNLDRDGYDTHYIGHHVCGIYLILFIHYTKSGSNAVDVIYRIDLSQKQLSWSPVILYQGTDLNFDPQHPAQIIFDYEANLVQKIYWVDGVNRPRLMNIVKPELKGDDYDSSTGYSSVYKDAPFDFIQDMSLDESCSVVRQNSTSGGVFPAGAIQYVLTYSFKYGQETNPFYTSEILYTSYNDRGGNPEDTINNAFKITVENPETKFDYLNIYSILRTALNGTPTIKRVTKIDLSKVTNDTVSYVDTNTTGENVDESYLLFSNRDIIADNIFNKDGTLFLGNLTYLRQNVKDIVGEDVIKSILHNAFTIHRTVAFDYNNQNSNYLYVNQLSQNTSYFRANETYRLGVQFQYKTGEWSEPIWLEDYTVDADMHPYFNNLDNEWDLKIPEILCSWGSYSDLRSAEGTLNAEYLQNVLQTLLDAGYIKMRPVVVLPEYYERTVLAQGVVNPTVFQAGARSNNTPHSYSSWIFRPMGSAPSVGVNKGLTGTIAEWRHLQPLVSGKSSAAEIQNMAIAEDYTSSLTETSKQRVLKNYEFWAKTVYGDSYNADISKVTFNTDLCVNHFSLDNIAAGIKDNINSVHNIWYVDQSVCTFHSPDIEFSDSKVNLLGNNIIDDILLTGLVCFDNTKSYIEINLATVQADPEALGTVTCSQSSQNGSGIVSGLYFHDGVMDDVNGGNLTLSQYDSENHDHGKRSWLTHMWHRTGSLNNDAIRQSTDTGTRTAELQTKKISNCRISNSYKWLSYNLSQTDGLYLPVEQFAVFNSDEISLAKLLDPLNSLGDIIYFGNTDVLNPSYTPYKLVCGGTHTRDALSYEDKKALENCEFTLIGRIVINTSPTGLEDSITGYNNNKLTGTITIERITSLANLILKFTINSSTYYDSDLVGCYMYLYYVSRSNVFSGPGKKVIIINDDNTTSEVKCNYIQGLPEKYQYAFQFISSYSGVNFDTLVTSITFSSKDFYYDENLKYLFFGEEEVDYVNLGDYNTSHVTPTDGVRIKYKSTPHGVFNLAYKNIGEEIGQYCMPYIEQGSDDIENTVLQSTTVIPFHTADENGDYADNDLMPLKTSLYWLENDSTLRESLLILLTADDAFSNTNTDNFSSCLWLCELHQHDVVNRFGGDTEEALLNNIWLPAGPSISIADVLDFAEVVDGGKLEGAFTDEDSFREYISKYAYKCVLEWQWGDTWYQRYDCLKTYPYSTEDVNQVVEIGSFFVETNVNIDGRYDRNRGLVDNTNVSPTNFNLINDVYSQKNNFFNYSMLDDDYYKTIKFPSQFIWSGVKTPGATNDEWTRTHLAASVDLDGSKGGLTTITCFADTVIGLQEKAMQRINFNPRALVDAGEGVAGVPIEIAHSLKVDGFNKLYDVGCQDKFSVLTTPNALYFIDHNNYILYSFDGKNGLMPLSENSGLRYWLKNNHANMSWMLRSDSDFEDMTNGIRMFYDSKYQDVYLTPGAKFLSNESISYPESLVFSEQLSRFTSLMSYGGSAMFEYEGRQYALAYSFEDESFNIYEMHSEDIDSYNTIFDKVFPFSFSFIFNGDSPATAKHMENIELRADCYDYTDEDGNTTDRIELQGGDYNIAKQDGVPFDFIRVRNEYQDTGIQYFNTLKDGVVALQTPTLRKKFRVWRAQIPRGTEGKNYRGQASRERIYNTWSEITLGKENPGTSMTILHNLNVTGGE